MKKKLSQFKIFVASGMSIRAAAAKANVSERTAYRHSTSPRFVQDVDQIRAKLIDKTLGLLANGTIRSARCLIGLVNDPSVRASVRCAAAKTVLLTAQELTKHCSFERRLGELENASKQRSHLKAI